MALDWLSTLGAQDQSLEGLMAKNDLSKKIALMNDVQQLGVQKQSRADALAEKQREFELRQKELNEAQAERTQRYAAAEQDRKDALTRQASDTTIGNLKPGMHVHAGPQLDLIKKYIPESAFTANPVDPNDLIYLKEAYDVATAKQAAQTAREEHAQKVADQHLALSTESNKRDAERLKMEQDRLDMAKTKAEVAQAKAQNEMKDLPASLRPAVKVRAEQLIKDAEGFLSSLDPWSVEHSKADMWTQAAKEVRESAEKSGLIPPKVPTPHVTGGRGGGPSTTPPPPSAPGGFTLVSRTPIPGGG